MATAITRASQRLQGPSQRWEISQFEIGKPASFLITPNSGALKMTGASNGRPLAKPEFGQFKLPEFGRLKSHTRSPAAVKRTG